MEKCVSDDISLHKHTHLYKYIVKKTAEWHGWNGKEMGGSLFWWQFKYTQNDDISFNAKTHSLYLSATFLYIKYIINT